jgi:DNA polymerase I-like protein with 3'-5' exonuclease and polymerase domains
MVCAPKKLFPDEIPTPKKYLLLSVDLSQAESWIVAFLARDLAMKDALMNDDIHNTCARTIFPELETFTQDVIPKKEFAKKFEQQRFGAKQTNHATSYMEGPELFTLIYNMRAIEFGYDSISIRQAKIFQSRWHNKFCNVKPWWDDILRELYDNGGVITTPYGRKRLFRGPINRNLQKEAVAYKPQNTVGMHFNGAIQKFNPVPGGLIEIRKRIPKEVQIVNQAHDSAIFITPTAIWQDVYSIAKDCLFRPVIVNGEEVWIPVDGEIGERWGELEKIK